MSAPKRLKMTTEDLAVELFTTRQCVEGGRPEAVRLLAELKEKYVREAADAIDSGKESFPDDVRSGASWASRMLRRMADEAAGGDQDA